MNTNHVDLPVDPLDVLAQRRSAKWRTYPQGVLPLTVAEMDFPLAPAVQAALRVAIDRSDTGYAMPSPDLGRALASFAGDRWGWDVDPDAVTAVTDVGVGVVQLLRAITNPGDAVVISPPVYPPFFDWVPESGARIVEVPLAEDHGRWQLDLHALEQAFANRPAAYLLCNPRNPVGTVPSSAELTALVELARAYDVTIVSDEIHSPLVFPEAAYTPILTVPGAADISVSVLSASKAWNLAGLKCAAVVTASPAMSSLVDRFPPDARWRTGHLGVIASVAAFTEATSWLDDLLATLTSRRALLVDLLPQHLPDVAWQPPEATYLAWLDCRTLGVDDLRAHFLARGVALEPGTRYGAPGHGYARLNFATSAEILTEAVTRMAHE